MTDVEQEQLAWLEEQAPGTTVQVGDGPDRQVFRRRPWGWAAVPQNLSMCATTVAYMLAKWGRGRVGFEPVTSIEQIVDDWTSVKGEDVEVSVVGDP